MSKSKNLSNLPKDKKDEIVAERIETAIKKLTEKNFTMFFYVIDSKNRPNNSMEYIYSMAYTLQQNGYNVKMCYQLDNEYTESELNEIMRQKKEIDENRMFIGVGEWMGKEFAEIPHMNVSKNEWALGPQDFLFIPEALSSLMMQTYKYHLTCKRIVILQNFDFVTDYIPTQAQWATFGINDAIAISDAQAALLRNVFPYVLTRVIPPYIPEMYRKPVDAKKLIINIVTQNPDDVNRVIKPFYWRYPLLRFVTFRVLNGKSRKEISDMLKESAATVWIDEKTNFGLVAVEAMRCGSIVIGKIPENIPAWMGDDEHLYDNGVWFTKMSQLPDIISSVVMSWMNDNIPEELTNAMEKTSSMFKIEEWEKNVKKTFDEIVNNRIEEIKTILEFTKVKKENNTEKKEESEEQ